MSFVEEIQLMPHYRLKATHSVPGGDTKNPSPFLYFSISFNFFTFKHTKAHTQEFSLFVDAEKKERKRQINQLKSKNVSISPGSPTGQSSHHHSHTHIDKPHTLFLFLAYFFAYLNPHFKYRVKGCHLGRVNNEQVRTLGNRFFHFWPM